MSDFICGRCGVLNKDDGTSGRSEEHTSELQKLYSALTFFTSK